MYEMTRTNNGFLYLFETELAASGDAIVGIPPVTANKRSINGIKVMQDDSNKVKIYGTLSDEPESTSLWQEIKQYDFINKTVTALKAVNTDTSNARTVTIRVLMDGGG